MGRIIAIANQKGGVGKTTTAINLSASLASLGQKVLALDMDPQGNMTSGLGVNKDEAENTVYDLIIGNVGIEECIYENVIENLDVLPSNINLSAAEIELIGIDNKEYLLKEEVDKIRDRYDFIIFDTGAGISDSVVRFSSISDTIIVVTQPEPTAITDAYAFMKVIKQTYDIKLVNVVFNRVDDIQNSDNVFASLKNVASKFLNMDLRLLGHLRDDKNVRKAIRAQKPVSILDPKTAFSRDIQDCARRFIGAPVEKQKSANVYDLFKGVFK